MRSIFLRTTAFASFSLLAACGPSRLSDADLTRLCELTVRCSSGIVSQASCEASLESQRDTANMQGCGGQFGAVGRCVIRADECTSGSLPEACQDEQNNAISQTTVEQAYSTRYGNRQKWAEYPDAEECGTEHRQNKFELHAPPWFVCIVSQTSEVHLLICTSPTS